MAVLSEINSMLTSFTFISLSLFFIFIIINGVEGRKDFQDLKLDRQLKILNKPYVKSIKTEEGDHFDCVNIYKQPAFDNPLLKNHKIQMKPSSLPKEVKSEASSTKTTTAEIGIKGGGCPSGTVPIRRTQKEDLIRAKLFMESHKSNVYGTANAGFHYAGKVLGSNPKEGYLGASSYINTHNPQVSDQQFSAADTLMQSGPSNQLDTIKFGWMVNPALYGDNKTHTFASWTANGSRGCYDTMCPGFVQVSPSNPVRQTLDKVSIIGGDQFEVRYIVTKDKTSGNWMLYYGNFTEYIGYWPSSLFTSLSSSAQEILWGGEVFSQNDVSPPMGSSYFPEAGVKRAAYMRDVQVVDQSNQMENPKEELLKYYTDSHDCYNSGPWDGESYTSFLFGGAGGKGCA